MQDANTKILPTIDFTKQLVQEKIKWMRKWWIESAYIHSLRVWDKLKYYWYWQDIQYWWYLHDIVEDWWITLQDLLDYWYTQKIVSLVDYCSQDMSCKTVEKYYKAWENMHSKILEHKNMDAFIIKFVDFMDNITQCNNIPNKDDLRYFLAWKAPYFVYYWNKFLWETKMYKDFLEIYWNQNKLFFWYFNNY